jgi:hypothetical protein
MTRGMSISPATTQIALPKVRVDFCALVQICSFSGFTKFTGCRNSVRVISFKQEKCPSFT